MMVMRNSSMLRRAHAGAFGLWLHKSGESNTEKASVHPQRCGTPRTMQINLNPYPLGRYSLDERCVVSKFSCVRLSCVPLSTRIMVSHRRAHPTVGREGLAASVQGGSSRG